jgi:hypothetical protein
VVSRSGWLSILVGSLVGAAILASTFAVSPNFAWSEGERESSYAGDFIQEYVGGSIVRTGDRSRLYDSGYFRAVQHDRERMGFDWDQTSFFPPIYPPFYYLWVSPLSRLAYRDAALLWAALVVGALLAALALLARSDPRLRRSIGWVLPAALLYTPVTETIVSGQKGTWLLLLFTGTYLLVSHRRLFAAGALFGCVAFKPQLALVVALVMLVKREWRFLAGMAATGVVHLALSLVVGLEACVDWMVSMSSPISQNESDLIQRSHNWLGFARLLIGDYAGPAVLALAVALVTATLLVLARVLSGPLGGPQSRWAIQFSAMVLATVLVSPHLYTYDLAILVLPMLLLVGDLDSRAATAVRQRRLLLCSLLAVFLMGGASPWIAQRIPVQCSALASFAVLIVLAKDRSQTEPAATAAR